MVAGDSGSPAGATIDWKEAGRRRGWGSGRGWWGREGEGVVVVRGRGWWERWKGWWWREGWCGGGDGGGCEGERVGVVWEVVAGVVAERAYLTSNHYCNKYSEKSVAQSMPSPYSGPNSDSDRQKDS